MFSQLDNSRSGVGRRPGRVGPRVGAAALLAAAPSAVTSPATLASLISLSSRLFIFLLRPLRRRSPLAFVHCLFQAPTSVEAAMVSKFLDPAMRGLTVGSSPSIWNSTALESPANGSHLGCSFAGAPSTIKAQIQWKVVLLDVVRRLGESEPTFCLEDSTDAMFQIRVSFRLTLNPGGASFADIAVIGKKCSTLHEAENEASMAALKELQYGRLRISMVDVSRMRCVELEKICYHILGNARALYHALKGVLLDWEEDMNKMEFCYASTRRKLEQNTSPTTYKNYGDINPNAADQLANLTIASYMKLKELSCEVEEMNSFINQVYERVEYFFLEPSADKPNEYRGKLPHEIKLSMKVLLEELMIFLGWAWPVFNISRAATGLYVCKTSMRAYYGYAGMEPQALTITGPEAPSEEDAVDSSCKAAISLLETEKSICLVDINYNHRSHGELYIIESKEAMQFGSVMSSRICAEWQLMVDAIHKCREYCQDLAPDPVDQEEDNSIEAIGELHKNCLADLVLARAQLKDAGASIVE